MKYTIRFQRVLADGTRIEDSTAFHWGRDLLDWLHSVEQMIADGVVTWSISNATVGMEDE